MHTLSPTAARGVQLEETRVAMTLDAERCLLANGRHASRAASCLLEPQTGDLVLVSIGEHCHVLHVLRRSAPEAALSVPGATRLTLRQRGLALQALDAIDITAAQEVRVSALAGSVSMNAPNLFLNVAENLVQQARHFVGRLGHCLLDVRHLYKLHAQDALITAERDIKADAERISMG